MTGYGEETNAIEGAYSALGIGPLFCFSWFPPRVPTSSGTGQAYHHLSSMIAIININVEDSSKQDHL